jgi:hypothetical protein
MNALTLDLVTTILLSVAAIAGTGLAVWILPWNEQDWEPRALPAKAPPPAGADRPAARVAHVPLAP